MNDTDHFPSVRLAAAGCLSLLLLLWIGFWGDASWPMLISGRHGVGIDASPFSFAVATGLALLILLILIPVLWRGPARDRWLAALLAVFPLSLFAVPAISGLFIRA
jgi:hypothetical protein